jgi:hypothetical protein
MQMMTGIEISGIETRRAPASSPPQAARPDLGYLCDMIAQERTLAATNRLKPYQSGVGDRLAIRVPTGGSDVLFGKERYINTYWLVLKESGQAI